MKSLKQICESSLTHPVYEVSILGDIDDQIEAYDNSIPDRIEKWIKDNYVYEGLKILDDLNKDGLYEVVARDAYVTNRENITSLTNGMFKWKKVNSFFDCSRCKSLKSLKGAPDEVGKNFNCQYCDSLESLKGAPDEVGGDFYCRSCPSLESLEGAPQKVGGNFDCCECKNISSLNGSPKEVGKNFGCLYCDSLKTLKGAPKKVGGDFYCYNCKKQFTEDDVKKVSDVKGKICVR